MNIVQVDSQAEDLQDFTSVNKERICYPNILNLKLFYCKIKNFIWENYLPKALIENKNFI